MSIERQDNLRNYYWLITELDIGSVARELLGSHVQHESARLLQCDCPRHTSQSHRSLHIMLDKQGWYCFGYGVGGDVLQLVEFIQSGEVTTGQSGSMPESHQRARDFLAARANLPPLAQYGLSPERVMTPSRSSRGNLFSSTTCPPGLEQPVETTIRAAHKQRAKSLIPINFISLPVSTNLISSLRCFLKPEALKQTKETAKAVL